MSIADFHDAAELAARRKASLEAGPCPHCGGPLDVELVETSAYGQVLPSFMPTGETRCARRCWERDPEGYIATVLDK